MDDTIMEFRCFESSIMIDRMLLLRAGDCRKHSNVGLRLMICEIEIIRFGMKRYRCIFSIILNFDADIFLQYLSAGMLLRIPIEQL